jgi:hypothetical protein
LKYVSRYTILSDINMETLPVFTIPETIGPAATLVTCNLDPRTCGHFRKMGLARTGGLCDHPNAPVPAEPHKGLRTCKTKPKIETTEQE